MTNELKLGQEQYQNMLNVVQWLDEHGDLYKRFVTHNLRRIDKNWYVVRARSARISSCYSLQHALRYEKYSDTNSPFYSFATKPRESLQTTTLEHRYPSTLTHGDVRGENILFPQEHRKDFMLFDFQLMKEVNGVTDIGYLLVSSMTVKERRVHEENLLVQYMNEMKKRGAADLTWEEIFVSYAYVSHLSLSEGLHLQTCPTNSLAHTVTCIITAFAVVDNISGEGKHDPKTRKTALEYVTFGRSCERLECLVFTETLAKKVHDDNTLDKFTLEEIMPILPSQKFRDLLKAESGSEFLQRAIVESVFTA